MTKRSLSDTSAWPPPSPRAPETGDTSPLRRLMHALESVTRKGDSWTSGWSARIPLPALAFKGDGEQELLLPLRPEDSQVIKKRGVVSQRNEGVDVAWEVRSDLIESRNPEWHDFMDERLAKIRARFGIFDHEEVEMPLRKMVLAETNARLLVEEELGALSRPRGRFGTFVVVLPGSFEGGDVVISRPDKTDLDENEDDDDDDEAIGWWPDDRDHPYCISYAAFYDHCECVAEPLQRGSALCLVFDLVTTPRQVDLLKGPQPTQHYVNSALSDYFRVVPEPLSKRLKISSDAWKTITDYAVDRNFVYILQGDEYGSRDKTFEDLKCDDRLIAESLAAFCAQSNGGYVLYLARVLCSRYVGHLSKSGDTSSDEEDTTPTGRFVTLKAPWRKYGESSPTDIPPVDVNQQRDVAPVGLVDQLPLARDRYHYDRVDYDISEHLYGDRFRVLKCVVCRTYALVVQPKAVEATQLTKVPIPEAVVRLRVKLSESREEGLRYARGVVSYRPECRVDPIPSEGFPDFVKLLIQIDDHQLFTDFLQSLELSSYDETGALSEAIHHFDWSACEETIIQRILSAPTQCGRVNLLVSVVGPCVDTERVDRLLDALLSRHPWTSERKNQDVVAGRDWLSSVSYHRLLDIVFESSPQRLIQVVSVKHAERLVHCVSRAVTSFVEARVNDPQAWHVLLYVRNLLTTMAPDIRNDSYAQVRIKDHCGICRDIQAFLSSTTIETMVPCTAPEDFKHIKKVLKDSTTRYSMVNIDVIGETEVRLTKNSLDIGMLALDAQDAEKRIAELFARSDRPPLQHRSLFRDV